MSRDPFEIVAQDRNLYCYLLNDPANGIDALAEDFIALADRDVGGSAGAYKHYSLQYWKSEAKAPCFRANVEGWNLENQASEAGSVELIPLEDKYKAWKYHRGYQGWRATTVDISVIHYNGDEGDRFVSIYTGTPEEVKNKWDQILSIARKYPYAEQNAREGSKNSFSGTFEHWPHSIYLLGLDATNSNTFVRYVVAYVKLTMGDLPGSHPGAKVPLGTDTKLGQNPKFWSGDPWPIGSTDRPPRPVKPPS